MCMQEWVYIGVLLHEFYVNCPLLQKMLISFSGIDAPDTVAKSYCVDLVHHHLVQVSLLAGADR